MVPLKNDHWLLAIQIFTLLWISSCANLKPGPDQHLKRPNIVVIMADDVGHNDFGLHGSNQIPTPNIDALGYNGVILDRFYTQSICTPSRAALLTGNYPIRTGLQGFPLRAGENRSLPSDIPTMPQQLKNLGYKTHLVGKWHLGSAYPKDTPTGRGFDTHFGYWNGFIGYFDHVNFQPLPDKSVMEGLDLHDQLKPVYSDEGKYATELFTDKSLEIIDSHNSDEPLFLVLAHLAAHAGKDGVELGVPNITETNLKYHYIKDPQRRRYADIINLMDESVGKIVKKLSDRDMLENSIVVFMSDNGAPTVGFFGNSGSNWPLRGLKMTEFEGGVRGVATIFSPLFEKKGYVNRELIHISDWLPTFYAAAVLLRTVRHYFFDLPYTTDIKIDPRADPCGTKPSTLTDGDLKDLGKIDGVNQWPTLSQNLPTKRSELLVNIDEVEESSAIIMDKGRYKALQGSYKSGLDQYFGESGREIDNPAYDLTAVLESSTNTAIQKTTEASITEERILAMRAQVDLSWCRSKSEAPVLNCTNRCLFDLEVDPCETINIIGAKPKIAERLFRRLDEFFEELVPQEIQSSHPNASPVYYNNTWCTWLDDELCPKTSI